MTSSSLHMRSALFCSLHQYTKHSSDGNFTFVTTTDITILKS